MDVRIVALAVLACVAGPVSASPHVVQIEGLLPDAEEQFRSSTIDDTN